MGAAKVKAIFILFSFSVGMSLHCLTLGTTKDCQKLDDKRSYLQSLSFSLVFIYLINKNCQATLSQDI